MLIYSNLKIIPLPINFGQQNHFADENKNGDMDSSIIYGPFWLQGHNTRISSHNTNKSTIQEKLHFSMGFLVAGKQKNNIFY